MMIFLGHNSVSSIVSRDNIEAGIAPLFSCFFREDDYIDPV